MSRKSDFVNTTPLSTHLTVIGVLLRHSMPHFIHIQQEPEGKKDAFEFGRGHSVQKRSRATTECQVSTIEGGRGHSVEKSTTFYNTCIIIKETVNRAFMSAKGVTPTRFILWRAVIQIRINMFMSDIFIVVK